MEKYYRFAGVDFLIDLPDDKMYADDRTLEPFRLDAVTEPHTFRFEMVDDLTPPSGKCLAAPPGFRVFGEGEWSVRYIGSVQESWEKAYIRAAHRDKEHFIQLKSAQFPGRVGIHTVLNCLTAEHLVAQRGGFVFHSSYIACQGKAILFTAPSGTGKSTQAGLWETLRGAEVINGDRSAVISVDGTVCAAGLPFAGSSGICKNRTLPLAAVVYLGQAPETTITRLTGFGAFSRIWEGCSINTWEPEDMRLVSGSVERLVKSVPVFHLRCTPDESAVIALEQILRVGGYIE